MEQLRRVKLDASGVVVSGKEHKICVFTGDGKGGIVLRIAKYSDCR
jgi:hypothetical protein